MFTATDFDKEIIESVYSCTDIAALFDDQLNYVAVNKATCEHLQMLEEDLLGRSIVDLFPQIIASQNHRNLLRALEGESILNFQLIGMTGVKFKTSYIPVYPEGFVKGILVNAQKIEKAA